MDLFTNIINEANNVLWTYVLIIMLLGCAIWFSVKTRFVQFRMLGEMIRLLGDSTVKINGHEKHISSYTALVLYPRIEDFLKLSFVGYLQSIECRIDGIEERSQPYKVPFALTNIAPSKYEGDR